MLSDIIYTTHLCIPISQSEQSLQPDNGVLLISLGNPSSGHINALLLYYHEKSRINISTHFAENLTVHYKKVASVT